MTDDSIPARCFRCGGPANELNEIEEGESCPACAERLIESVAGVFHAPWAVRRAAEVAQEEPLDEARDGALEREAAELRPHDSRRQARRSGGAPYPDEPGPRPA